MSEFTFDEKTHTYRLDGKKLTGVTTVLGVIAKPALIGWAANMSCDYIKDHASKEALAETGMYLVPKDVLEDARKAHARKKDKRAKEGHDTHFLVERYVKECIANNDGKPFIPIHEEFEPIQRFITWALSHESCIFMKSEKVMYHPEWFVGGTADIVVVINGQKFVADIKTQKKIWDRVPFIQMSAYRGMLEDMGESDFDGSIIIHLPEKDEYGTEQPLEAHYSYDYESDLQAWLNALGLYRYLRNY